MKNRRLSYIVACSLIFIGIGLISCEVSPASDVVHAEAVDWIWGYEELRSGSVRVWLRYDDVAGYCTGSKELVKLAKEHNGELVRIEFATSKWADKESPNFFSTEGCSKLTTGTDSSTPIFKILSIEPVDEGDYPNE